MAVVDTTITPDAVISEWGSYFLDAGQNMDDIKMRPFETFGTKDAFTVIDTGMDTVLRRGDVQLTEIIQAYQDNFTPKGSVTFLPIEIGLKQMKIDQKFNPSKLQASWLGFLTSNNTDRTTWPFVRWFIDKYIMGQHDKDIETKAIYGGVYNAPTTDTAGDADEVMDGVEILINNGIDASSIVPITTGAPSTTPATWCTQVETFCKAIPELYWGETMVLNMSKVLHQRYRDGVRAKYNMNYAQETQLDKIADFDGITVAGRFSMVGKTKIWMTPKWNALLGVKGYSNINAFELEKIDRFVKVWTDWFMGIGFLLYDLIWTNDQELPA